MKCEAELREVRRMQAIKDAKADEEWREIHEEIQQITALTQSGSSKTKKKGCLRELFKRKIKCHPLADI